MSMRADHSYQRSDVALGVMSVNPQAQRECREYRVNELLASFDLDVFGEPTLNWINGVYHIIDGQHRTEALKQWLGEGWEKQKIPCRVYKGLTDQEEADMFDRLNNTLTVSAFSKFKVRVTARREVETAIDNIVRDERLVISRDKVPGAIGAIGTLVRVYKRSDGETLAKSLRIIRDAFGDSGFDAQIIDGIGHLCQRYNGTLDEPVAVDRLSTIRGGVAGLLGRAAVLKKQTGNSHAQCVAASAVDIINARRGGKKLPSWWKTMQEEDEK